MSARGHKVVLCAFIALLILLSLPLLKYNFVEIGSVAGKRKFGKLYYKPCQKALKVRVKLLKARFHLKSHDKDSGDSLGIHIETEAWPPQFNFI